jgi:hypothetical protein
MVRNGENNYFGRNSETDTIVVNTGDCRDFYNNIDPLRALNEGPLEIILRDRDLSCYVLIIIFTNYLKTT